MFITGRDMAGVRQDYSSKTRPCIVTVNVTGRVLGEQ